MQTVRQVLQSMKGDERKALTTVTLRKKAHQRDFVTQSTFLSMLSRVCRVAGRRAC